MGVDGSIVPNFGKGFVTFVITLFILAGFGVWKFIELFIYFLTHLQWV